MHHIHFSTGKAVLQCNCALLKYLNSPGKIIRISAKFLSYGQSLSFLLNLSSPCANAASIVSASHSFNFPGVRDKKKLFEVERMQRMYWCGCFCFECCREVEMQPGKVFFSKSSLSLKVYQNKHQTAVENHSGGKLTVVAIVSCSFSTIIR